MVTNSWTNITVLPSPLLLKLVANQVYWTVTSIFNDQNINDKIPNIFSTDGVIITHIIAKV